MGGTVVQLIFHHGVVFMIQPILIQPRCVVFAVVDQLEQEHLL